MANWQKTVDVHEIISTYDDSVPDADVARVAGEVADLLYQHTEFLPLVSKVRACTTEGEFNRAIHEVYDQADRTLVWLGMPR